MALTLQDVITGISNGTINEYVLSETLEELKLSSYRHLYNIQRDMVNIDKFKFYYRELTDEQDVVFTKDKNYTYKSYILPKSFIYNNYRHKFRHQPFFNKPLTNDIINDHRDIFIYNYLVFVGGKLDLSARIRCKEELTEICLNEKFMVPEIREKFKLGCAIDVVFLKHSYFINIETTKKALVSSDYKFDVKSIYFKDTDRLFAFVQKEGGAPKLFETTFDNNGKVCVSPKCGLVFNDDEKMFFSFLVVNNVCERFDVPKETNYIQNKKLNMPLPKTNTLIFTKGENDEITVDCTKILTEKYPDIFQVNANRNLDNIVYTLYYDNKANNDMVFDRDTNYYSKLISVIDKYNKNSVANVLANYNPLEYEYDLNDFHKYDLHDLQISPTDHTNIGPLMYKANKLNIIFKLWAYVLELYKSKEIDLHGLSGYYLDLTGKDLDGKLRFNNFMEITVPTNKESFDEPRYLFTYKCENNSKLPYKFFVDGLFYNPDKVYIENGYEYVYIPQKMITPTSIIEIERSRNISFKQELNITNKAIPLRFPSDDIVCPFKSIFLVDVDMNYVDDWLYQIYATINGTKVVFDKDSTMLVSNATEMYIQPISDDAAFKTIYAMCNDVPATFNKEINLNNHMEKNLNIESLIHNIKPDENRIRVFKHGLLIPKEKYAIEFPKNLNGNVKIGLQFDKYINTFNVDYLPEGYNTVHSAEEIDKSGIINLEGIINKPFSLKYYDVYLNGYRLNQKQIEKITNFTIRVKDVKTIRKLRIYEKDVGREIYKFEGNSDLLSDILLREDPEFMAKLLEYAGQISVDDSIIDVDTMFDVIENLLIGLIVDHLEFNYIDCNLDEIPDEVYNKYAGFFKSPIFFIDCAREYKSGDSDEKIVYFIAPQAKDEIFRINDPYYVSEFNLMLDSFASSFINANTDVDLAEFKQFPSVIGVDNIIKIDGSKTVERFATGESKLLGQQVINK